MACAFVARIAGCHAQGCVHPEGQCGAPQLEDQRAHHARTGRASPGAGSARSEGHPVVHAHRPSRSDHLSLLGQDRGRTLDRSQPLRRHSRRPCEGAKREVRGSQLLAHAGPRQRTGVWYAGSSPQGLFRSEDGGNTWQPVKGLNDHPEYSQWMGAQENGTPDGPKLHSVIVDPRDRNHLYVAMSSGGVHESLDRGATWRATGEGPGGSRGISRRSAVCARPALRAPVPLESRSPLPAESLRHLPARPPGRRMGAHRQAHAEEHWRRRLSDGGASAQRQGVLGIPDGWQQGVAAHRHRWQARGLHHAQCRQELAAARQGPSGAGAPGGR